MDFNNCGKEMHSLLTEMFPICRSITGEGVRKTLNIIRSFIPIKINEVPTGEKVFDWVIPMEWNISDAFILDQDNNKILDFKNNNLHVIGYSTPIDRTISLEELQGHLYSLEEQPNAIPYITSYYKDRWGFCISHNERKKLKEGKYRVFIDSKMSNGYLTYGELIIPGETENEIFLSTYICHPSMANNELSGPVVTAFLTKWLLSKPRKYTYRIIYIPETIGSITYLSKNLALMKKNIIAGFNITCVGDERAYSFLPSRNGSTIADKAAMNILETEIQSFKEYSFLDRGSDERQYCSPGIDLPVVSIMRSKYMEYPEYHTSLDNLDFVTPAGLQGALNVLMMTIKLLECNKIYRVKCYGEPQLGKRGLYPTLGTKQKHEYIFDMLNFIAYADGENDLIDISNIIKVPAKRLYPIVQDLLDANLIAEV